MEEKHWTVLKALGFGLLALCLAFTSGTMIGNGNTLLAILTALVALWWLWQAILEAALLGAIMSMEKVAKDVLMNHINQIVEEGQ